MLSQPTAPLYAVKNHTGAHSLRDLRETDAGEIATVHLIGADLPYDVDRRDLTPYTTDSAYTGDALIMLAQEAAILYGQDPGRINRATEIARRRGMVLQAHRDEDGNAISPSLSTICVRGATGWYIVRPGSCTCQDTAHGHVCKHRIAAWMHREIIIRPLAQVRRVTPAIILAELSV
jgi:hypothetical protein